MHKTLGVGVPEVCATVVRNRPQKSLLHVAILQLSYSLTTGAQTIDAERSDTSPEAFLNECNYSATETDIYLYILHDSFEHKQEQKKESISTTTMDVNLFFGEPVFGCRKPVSNLFSVFLAFTEIEVSSPIKPCNIRHLWRP